MPALKATSLAVALTAIASTLPLPFTSPAFAASGCEAYTADAIAAANRVKELACGFDLNHPQWSPNPEVHRRWCRFASQESVDHEMLNRFRKESECSTCRAYANAAMAAVAVNNERKCGYTGPAWQNNAAAHFNWCMGLKSSRSYLEGIEKSIYEIQRESLDPQTAARTQAAEQCKLTHKADQALTVLPPALQPEGRPTGVAVITNIQRPGPKGSVTPVPDLSVLPNMQRRGPKGSTTPDKAVPSRSSTKVGNVRITPRNIDTCRSPCKPSSIGMGRVLLKNNPSFTLQRSASIGGTRGGGLRLR